MHLALSCPQCQGAFKLLDPPRPGKMVKCPACRVEFILDEAALGTTASRGPSLAPVIALLVVAIGVGVGIWFVTHNSHKEESMEEAQNPAAPELKQQQSTTNPPTTTPEAITPQVPEAKAAPANPPVSDELPDAPPMTKKPPSNTEKKRPLLDEPPPPLVEKAKPVPPPTPPAQPAPQEPPQPKALEAPAPSHPRQREIDAAIDKGVGYLKNRQMPNGSWSPAPNDPSNPLFGYQVGYAALAGLTLLECQVPANDPAVRKAADYVRTAPITDPKRRTYEMATVLLFLDRLGDPQDSELIQAYALQLIAGQRSRGGWNYDCPALTKGEMDQLLTFLQATRIAVPEIRDPLQKSAKGKTGDLEDSGANDQGGKSAKKNASVKKPPVPAVQALGRLTVLPIVQLYYFNKLPSLAEAGPTLLEDNSNTQFALLALWAARRQGIPTERALLLAGHRFTSSQNPDGGWGYNDSGGLAPSTATMTCVGLLGLAMAQGSTPAKGTTAPAKLPENPAVVKALRKLGEHVDTGSMRNFYLLWSIERVAVLYGLKTIGNREWYDIGVDLLLPSQQPDGSWLVQSYPGSTAVTDTCFALLFLRRSNLVSDLTERLPLLMGISDPDRTPKR